MYYDGKGVLRGIGYTTCSRRGGLIKFQFELISFNTSLVSRIFCIGAESYKRGLNSIIHFPEVISLCSLYLIDAHYTVFFCFVSFLLFLWCPCIHLFIFGTLYSMILNMYIYIYIYSDSHLLYIYIYIYKLHNAHVVSGGCIVNFCSLVQRLVQSLLVVSLLYVFMLYHIKQVQTYLLLSAHSY